MLRNVLEDKEIPGFYSTQLGKSRVLIPSTHNAPGTAHNQSVVFFRIKSGDFLFPGKEYAKPCNRYIGSFIPRFRVIKIKSGFL
jgi:hypothetical protein